MHHRMSQLAIVNAPSSFTAIWAVMRPWLAKETVEKVSVLGSNYASALLKLVDPENLPKSLGGTCTCEDCDTEEGGDAPKVGGVEGQMEMGKCAFSSAGPWMVGRKERREAWLRGERQIALGPGELDALSQKLEEPLQQDPESDSGSTPQAEERHEDIDVATVEQTAPDERKDDAEESASAGTVSTTDESSASSGPSTPPLDAVQGQLGDVKISDGADETHHKPPLTTEQSMKTVEKTHPETRIVEAGDLHAE